MKDTIVGCALGLALLAGLFAAAHFLPRGQMQSLPVSAAFVGERHFGGWILVCAKAPPGPARQSVPIPFSLTARSAYQTDVAERRGRCRVSLLLVRKGDPKHIVLAAHFRLRGQARVLTLVLRFPAIGKAGQWVAVRAGEKALRLPVISCNGQFCTAGGRLGPPAESLLYQAPAGRIYLPSTEGGRHPALPLPLAGLKQAISGMRRAENSQAGQD